MLKHRVLTALVLIPLVLLAIFYLPQPWFGLLLGAIMLGCAWEWSHLMKLASLLEKALLLLVVGMGCYAAIWLPMGYYLYLMMLGVCALIYLVHRYQRLQGQMQVSEIWWYVIGILMFITCWYSINIIRFRAGGSEQVLMLLLIVWLSDTAAYFSGNFFGKTPLAPLVSPKKSWEGVKGAALAVFILTLIEVVLNKMSFAKFSMVLLVNAATFVVAVYGDLFESMMKRMADCKDSGSLLPGHGGLLDRLDSLFFAAPCYATGMLLISIYFGAS